MSNDLYAFRRETTKPLAGDPTTQLDLTYTGRKYVTFNGGDLSLGIHVPGYWHGETIVLRWNLEDDEPDIKYGSGGYERDFSNLARARNFAVAMTFAAEVAQNWVMGGWQNAFTAEFDLADERVVPQ